MGQLWHTYCRSAGGRLHNPEAPPRKKRHLRLGDKDREVYKLTTEDKVTNCVMQLDSLLCRGLDRRELSIASPNACANLSLCFKNTHFL